MSELMNRLARKHLEQRAEWLAPQKGDDADEITWAAESRRNRLHAMRQFDPRARFREELTLRLIGEAACGDLDLGLTDLLSGVQRTFLDGANVGMSLTGVSAGSTVLHFTPTGHADPPPVAEDDNVPVDASSADAVGRQFIAMVSAAQNSSDVREWTSLVRGLELTVDALDRYELDAQMIWASHGGSLAAAVLDERGRSYVRSFKHATPERRPRSVSGRVTELRASGWFKLKQGTTQTSPVAEIRIDQDTLLALRLELGETVHVEVEESVWVDALGRSTRQELAFVRRSATGDSLPLDGQT